MTKEASLLMIVLFGCCLHEIAAISSFAADCLREHNKVRAQHGAAPLTWDATLASHAQKWADKLNKEGTSAPTVHSKNKEGENIAMLTSPNCQEAVEEWSDEGYDYEDLGYCSNPPRVPASYVMHFTQLVWKNTKQIGVAVSGNYLVARYMPSGNYYAQYGNNVQC